jgi:hypothetical protein
MADEKTSPELAALAGRILGMTDDQISDFAAQHPASIRSVVASLLTQARDRHEGAATAGQDHVDEG